MNIMPFLFSASPVFDRLPYSLSSCQYSDVIDFSNEPKDFSLHEVSLLLINTHLKQLCQENDTTGTAEQFLD